MIPYSDYAVLVGILLFLFLAAIGVYQLLFMILQRTLGRGGAGAACLKRIRRPVFFLFLELGALVALDILLLPEAWYQHIHRAIIVLIIATIGITFALGANGLYQYLLDKYRVEAIEDISRRSLLTQTQILYRFFLFVIIVLTISCILITFPNIRSLGFGLLGSAGVAGIALGIAARPILLNLLAGVQIALTKILKIGDMLFVEGEIAKVEHLFLTHVVLVMWDQRRLFLPISQFIDKPFQNWSSPTNEFIASAILYLDYAAPIDVIRSKLLELLQNSPTWNGIFWKVEVIDATEQTISVRLSMSSYNVVTALSLRTEIREQMIVFLQEHYPDALPRIRQAAI